MKILSFCTQFLLIQMPLDYYNSMLTQNQAQMMNTPLMQQYGNSGIGNPDVTGQDLWDHEKHVRIYFLI